MTAAGEIFPQVFRMNLHLFHRLLFTYEIICGAMRALKSFLAKSCKEKGSQVLKP